MKESDSPRARFGRLKTAYHAGLPAVTVLLARPYLADYPDHWPVWVWLGDVMVELDRFEEAGEALTEALRRCPGDRLHFPLIYTGHLHGARGDLEQAAEWYQKAIEAQPRHASGSIYLGGVFASQGHFCKAEEVYRKATETCDEGCLDEAYLNLGLILLTQERFRGGGRVFT